MKYIQGKIDQQTLSFQTVSKTYCNDFMSLYVCWCGCVSLIKNYRGMFIFDNDIIKLVKEILLLNTTLHTDYWNVLTPSSSQINENAIIITVVFLFWLCIIYNLYITLNHFFSITYQEYITERRSSLMLADWKLLKIYPMHLVYNHPLVASK